MAYIELNQVSFSYPDASSQALRDVSLTVEKGQFVVLFGASGSGKSTLLRLVKKEIQPHGKLSGTIHAEVKSPDVGFVFQDPENQVVADQVLHELVFGLENRGLSTNEMRNRVAEMVHFFDAEPLLHRKTHELSGGQKQQMNLASVLLMQPDVLLLDEPTAQLDPVSARGFLDMLVRLNEEFGMTIILAEHRLEEVFTGADKIVMMDNGQIVQEGNPRKVLKELWESPLKAYVPSIPSLFLELKGMGELPLTVKEGRCWAQQQVSTSKLTDSKTEVQPQSELMKLSTIYYQYDKKSELVLKEVDFSINKGEIYALLGGNGSGKSTLLKVLAGIYEPQRGKVLFEEKPLKSMKKKEARIGYLPQNPKLFFIHDTVEGEIQATMEQWGIKDRDEVEQILIDLGISHLCKSHPYDLSGGELQKAALACLLLRKPEILILDEPTKGLDPLSKGHLVQILQRLNQEGMTIMMSTHDVEFAAQYATKCGMMFQGKITAEDIPRNFFRGNFFYTTMLQRLFRSAPDASIVTFEEAVRACTLNKR
ncbi:ABC transporter ATP-binding protein [Bacillus luteolus]|uniref:ABC transporter ATP-binding protein n=1 Tax=Litchfieldia luteola TaxID=682179 RepID=A0ABR9QF59_9BACI|nr:energy-coupling factor transporter ATPase [Cytobacillus luteolus]MBE4907134.1 ABC transporter ATP-binding protein [Cytobacillus luteolus]MBP1943396.1 energy-coupling factor transport system ATP-binding protein [Cytobacillus luteolus]